MSSEKITILGAGLAGLSCSYHIGHQSCILYEMQPHAGGHIYSHVRNGFTWDEGPHVSFTKHEYVRNLFAESVGGKFVEQEVDVANYYKGVWIPHPAQSNLWAVPEPLRSECLSDFIASRTHDASDAKPSNYAEWLKLAFGEVFKDEFAAAYTKKYWTCHPEQLAVDWVGQRVFYPDMDTVKSGFFAPPERSHHYINQIRYPESGGYISFAKKLSDGATIKLNHQIVAIDLQQKQIYFRDQPPAHYDRLINTLPLPKLIEMAAGAPQDVREAAKQLKCSHLTLVNVAASHKPLKPFHWMYVYDQDKISTRINQINLLSTNNAPVGQTGIQVEVYQSDYFDLGLSRYEIEEQVYSELREMGILGDMIDVHSQEIEFANVIFDTQRRAAQEQVLSWLEGYGLFREADDLEPMIDWNTKELSSLGDLVLAGRFGQWKYFWTDDCVLRGRHIAESLAAATGDCE